MFSRLLIANRGEIACRIIAAARKLGIATVAVHSDADRSALHVRRADEAVQIGGPAPADSYLCGERIIEAARRTGADAIHPGYGFLSENAAFADAVQAAGLTFIGPPSAAIRAMGLKDAAKTLMTEAGVPVVPGYHGRDQDPSRLAEEAAAIGYPVLIKARAGGGGKGMRRVDRAQDFAVALAGASREGAQFFDDSGVLIEKYIPSPRHIEVQVFADGLGNVVHLYERDCSLQRRHQKVIEEAPAPGMCDDVREAMTTAATAAARAIDYVGAGTVEFIVDGRGALRPDGFWFMEMNTRLQVEHPVTEAVTGIDLVEWQLQIAAGLALPRTQADIALSGHAIEARLYAEDPGRGFLPSTGRLDHLSFGRARVDTGVETGDTVSAHYDPMIAKLIVHGGTRDAARHRLQRALADTHVVGVTTNAFFLFRLLRHDTFANGAMDTGLIERDLELLTDRPADDGMSLVVAALALRYAAARSAGTLDVGSDRRYQPVGPPYWRAWGTAMERVVLRDDGGAHEIRLLRRTNGTVSVEIGAANEPVGADAEVHEGREPTGKSGPAESARQGGMDIERLSFDAVDDDVMIVELTVSGRRMATHCVLSGRPHHDGVSVLIDGVTRTYRRQDPLSAARGVDAGADTVTAPMTGRVQGVHIRDGDEVEAGQPLLVLEAMKMEHTLCAPRDGVVSGVHVTVGANVQDGDRLVDLAEPRENEETVDD